MGDCACRIAVANAAVMSSRLVLCLGDLFIPDRAPDIPQKFKKLLTPGKIGQILCLGNLTDRKTHDWLRNLAPELHLVKVTSTAIPHPPLSHSPRSSRTA